MTKIHRSLTLVALLGFVSSLVACDTEEGDVDEPTLNAEPEDLEIESESDAYEHAVEVKPFAVIDLPEGRHVRFFVLNPELGDVLVGESASNPGLTPRYVGFRRSPLEIFWELTHDDVAIPEELLTAHETYHGDIATFLDNAGPRGSALVTEITPPPPPPQAAKWWSETCSTTGTGYNYTNCKWGTVPSSGFHYHKNGAQPFLTTGQIAYTVVRDSLDTNREWRLYYNEYTGEICTWSFYVTMATGWWDTYEYTEGHSRSWQGRVTGGCSGTCYDYGASIFWDTNQSSTCGNPVG
jgi:hypothetical protein